MEKQKEKEKKEKEKKKKKVIGTECDAPHGGRITMKHIFMFVLH